MFRRLRLIVCLSLLSAAVTLVEGAEAGDLDSLSWTPPKEPPTLPKILPITQEQSEYMQRAMARVKFMRAEVDAWPEEGVIIEEFDNKSPYKAMGVKWQDLVFKIDGKPVSETERNFQDKKPHTLTLLRNGKSIHEIKTQGQNIMGHTTYYTKPTAMPSAECPSDPRWDAHMNNFKLLADADAALAERELLLAIEAGFPHDNLTYYRFGRLAYTQSQYDRALDFMAFALKENKPEKSAYIIIQLAAAACGKLDAITQLVPPDKLIGLTPDVLEATIKAYRQLPLAVRATRSPLAEAEKLFKDDLLMLSDLVTIEYGNDKLFDNLVTGARFSKSVETGRYQILDLKPRAKNVLFKCHFSVRATMRGPAYFSRVFEIAFLKKTDSREDPCFSFRADPGGLAIESCEGVLLADLGRPIDFDDESRLHELSIAIVDDLAECKLDGTVVFNAPAIHGAEPLMPSIRIIGTTVQVRDVQLFDLLNEAQYRKRVTGHVNTPQKAGFSRLHRVAFHGLEREAQILMELGGTGGAPKAANDETPVHTAIHQGHPEIAKLLLKDAVPPDALIAAGLDDVEALKNMINQKDAAKQPIRWTPWHGAAACGAQKSLEFLLSMPASINNNNTRTNQTPLTWAVMCGRKETVEWLIKSGADVNVKDNDKFTAADHARWLRRQDIFKILVESKKSIRPPAPPREEF